MQQKLPADDLIPEVLANVGTIVCQPSFSSSAAAPQIVGRTPLKQRQQQVVDPRRSACRWALPQRIFQCYAAAMLGEADHANHVLRIGLHGNQRAATPPIRIHLADQGIPVPPLFRIVQSAASIGFRLRRRPTWDRQGSRSAASGISGGIRSAARSLLTAKLNQASVFRCLSAGGRGFGIGGRDGRGWLSLRRCQYRDLPGWQSPVRLRSLREFHDPERQPSATAISPISVWASARLYCNSWKDAAAFCHSIAGILLIFLTVDSSCCRQARVFRQGNKASGFQRVFRIAP